MSNPKPKITAEALSLCHDHQYAKDANFLVDLSEALAGLHHTALLAERIAVLNQITGEHTKRLDADAIAEIRAEAAQAERERISAILTSAAAKGREEAAMSLALNPALSAGDAIGLLDTLHAQSYRPEDYHRPEGLLTVDGEYVMPTVSPEPFPMARGSAKQLWKTAVQGINSNPLDRA